MSTCRSGCRTHDHASWGECARAASFQIGDLTGTGQRTTTDRRLKLYAEAKRQGIQPQGTKVSDSLGALRAAGA